MAPTVSGPLQRTRMWLGVVAIGIVVAVVSLAPSAAQASLTIHITSGVDPASVTVPPNTAITFVNDDGSRHRMRTTGGPAEFDTGNLEAGQAATVTLTAIGSYSYRDERNTSSAAYVGQIVVSDAVTTTVPGTPTTPAPPPPSNVSVSIGDRIFSPSSVTVAPGGTVTWTNNDSRAHTVTANDRSFDSGLLNPGASWSHVFPNGGTFAYFCELHPDMTGRVVVSTGSTPPPPPATTTPATPTTRPTTTAPVATTVPATLPPGTPPPATASVMIMGMQFQPGSVTIAAGGTVTWTNHDTAPHTVTADDGGYDSGMLRAGDTWSRTFTTPGTYRYHCDFHPEMVATVTVLPPGATVPPGSGPTAPTTVEGGGSAATTTTTTSPAGGGSGGDAGGSGSGATLATSGSVSISGNAFSPATITIAVGGTVTWTNRDAVPHTVTADDSSFDSGMLRNGDTYSRTFTAPGTYTYFCSFHPGMTAKVVVATPEDPNPAVVTGGPSGHAAGSTIGASTASAATGGQVGAGSAAVTMTNSRFSPVSVTVGTGGVVTWTNTDTVPHTVTAADGSFDSDILMPGQTFSYQFDAPGTVGYRCSLHVGMTGEVVVSELPADATGAHGDQGVPATSTPIAVPAESPDRTISITGGAFPAVTVLAAGHSVTWVNDDTVDHDVVALDGFFESGLLHPGESFTFTFDEPSVHPYTCDIHRHMGGTIIVMPADDVDLANAPTVQVANGGFEPADLTVRQGATVVWAFGGELPHTVTASDGSFDSGIMQPGQTFSYTFDELGSFHYSCILHPAMMGTITVVAADAEVVESGASVPTTEPPTTAAVAGGGPSSSGGPGTPIVVGIGVGGGLLAAVLLALGVAAATRRTPRLTA